MKEIERILVSLLKKKKWNPREKEWMSNYLKDEDDALLKHQVRKKYYQDLRDSKGDLDKQTSDRILKEIHGEISKRQRKRRLNRVAIVAASVFVFLISGYIYWNLFGEANMVSVEYAEVTTIPGQTEEVILKDGTRIWVGPESTLEYPEEFRGNIRKVRLSGEAFFDVNKDSKHPFIVESDRLKVNVLGTSFGMSAYDNRNYETVTVASGKVGVVPIASSINNRQEEVVPNKRAVFTKSSGKLLLKQFPDADKVLLDRRDGILEYNGTKLIDVVRDLSLRYGVKIKIDDPTMKDTYYGKFNTRRDKVTTSLKLLCLALDARFVKKGETYIITRI